MRAHFFLLLLLPGLGIAQDNTPIDSLKKVVQTSRGDDKANAYQLLITELQTQNPTEALHFINELKTFSLESKHSKGLVFTYYQLGLYYNLKGRYDSVKIYADKCLQEATDNKQPQGVGLGYHLSGTYYWQVGMYDKAMSNHIKALKVRQRLRDSAAIGASLASLSVVCLSANKLEKAQAFIQKALTIGKRINDDRLTLRSLHTQANIYGIQGFYAKALKADHDALKILSKTRNLRGFSEIYSNMALCYFYQGNLDTSLAYHYKVLDIDKFFKDDKQIGDTYLNLALIYRKKKQHETAVSLLTQAIDHFKRTNYKSGLKHAYLSLSDAYRETGHFKNAYSHYLTYNKIANELSSEANDRHIAVLNLEYETEQREQKIKSLSQQALINHLELKQRNIFLLVALSIMLAGIVIAYLFYKHRKLAEKTRLQQEINKQQKLAAKAIFVAEEQERHRIATELHDGVGQSISSALVNLNMLFQRVDLVSDEKKLADTSLALIGDGYDELRHISHQMVPHSLLKKGLIPAIEDLLQRIDDTILKTRLEVSGFKDPLGKETESALYRIVQEAINNVLKHANATRLSIQLVKDEDGISLTIEDNGKGFDVNKLTAKEGIGLRNIQTRVDFLRGVSEVDSRIGGGTFISINLPSSTPDLQIV